jgi:hypothetical protein
MRQQFLAAIRVRIKPRAQDDDLGGTTNDRTLQCFVDEARTNDHHPNGTYHFDVCHRVVVAEAQRADGRVIQIELRRIAEEFLQLHGDPRRRLQVFQLGHGAPDPDFQICTTQIRPTFSVLKSRAGSPIL